MSAFVRPLIYGVGEIQHHTLNEWPCNVSFSRFCLLLFLDFAVTDTEICTFLNSTVVGMQDVLEPERPSPVTLV